MMSKNLLGKKQVEHIARLANLDLTKKELIKFQRQLSEVLGYIALLDKLDTKEVEPTSQVTGLENVFREDKPRPSLSQDEVLSGARATHNGMFKIRPLFE